MNPVCPKSGNRVRPATANSRLLHFGEKSHEASVLDRDGELALILGAGAGDGTRGDLAIGSDELAKDFVFLVRSLGYKCRKATRIPHYTYKGEYKDGARSHRIRISSF